MTRLLSVVVACTGAVALVSCGATNADDPAPNQSPAVALATPSLAPSEVTSMARDFSPAQLGRAVNWLIYDGAEHEVPDYPACMAQAVRAAGVSDSVQRYLAVQAGSGSEVQTARQGIYDLDAASGHALYSEITTQRLDECAGIASEATTSLGSIEDFTDSSPSLASTPATSAPVSSTAAPEPSDEPGESMDPPALSAPADEDLGIVAPDLNARYEVPERITDPSQIAEGAAQMFASFVAEDPGAAQRYLDAADCLGEVIYDSGLSNEAKRFIGTGAPVSVGGVIDHLPTDADREVWSSPQLRSDLAACTLSGS